MRGLAGYVLLVVTLTQLSVGCGGEATGPEDGSGGASSSAGSTSAGGQAPMIAGSCGDERYGVCIEYHGDPSNPDDVEAAYNECKKSGEDVWTPNLFHLEPCSRDRAYAECVVETYGRTEVFNGTSGTVETSRSWCEALGEIAVFIEH